MGHSRRWHREAAHEARLRDEARRGVPAMSPEQQEEFVERVEAGAHADLREWLAAGMPVGEVKCPICGLTAAQLERSS
jgi:hypothetical protein